MKRRPPFEREPSVPEFDPGKPRAQVEANDNGVDLVLSPTTDQRAMDRVAELLDQLFADAVPSRR